MENEINKVLWRTEECVRDVYKVKDENRKYGTDEIIRYGTLRVDELGRNISAKQRKWRTNSFSTKRR